MVIYDPGMALFFHLQDSEIRDGATVQIVSAPPSPAYERDAKKLDAGVGKLLEPGLLGRRSADSTRCRDAESSAHTSPTLVISQQRSGAIESITIACS